MNRFLFAGAAALAVEVLLASNGAALAGRDVISEIRFGAYQHDTGLVGTHKEAGADLAFEVLTRPVTALEIILSPRIEFGGALNTAGKTSVIYLGLDKQYDYAHGVFNAGDALFIEGTVGGAWHNGKLDVSGTPEAADWKSHGSRFVFRTGFAFGYRFNERWSVAANFNHFSNANLAEPNEGMNDIGVLLGYRL